MNSSLRQIVLFLLLALPLAAASAQPGRYPPPGSRPSGNVMIRSGSSMMQQGAFIRGTVVLSPEEKGGEETPGVGVTVMIVSIPSDEKAKSDTIYAVVGETGRFFLPAKPGKAFVKFSMMGYEELAKTIPINPGENKIVANLKPVTEQLAAAVVKEVVDPLSIKGDTLVFHAAAVKTNAGEKAIDILEQMPGVEVSSNSVSVLNEEVKNVYIDGALLFGEAPMKALNNLAAEEVVTIKSYQEYANKDPRHVAKKTEDKQRVLDIETKSKPKMVVAGDFSAGGGFDTDTTFHKFRYTTGAEVMLFSEKLQANMMFNINNINDESIRTRSNFFRSAGGGDNSADLRNINVNASVRYRWMSKEAKNFELATLRGSYSYTDQYNVNESLSEQIYCPSDKFDSRTTESGSYSSTSSKAHSFSANASKALADGRLSASAYYSMNDGLTVSRNRTYNYQDDLPKQGTASSTRRTTDRDSYSVNLDFNKGFWNKLRVGASGSYDHSGTDGSTVKVDTTTSTITYKTIDMASDNGSRSLGLRSYVRYDFNDKNNIGIEYRYNDSYRSSLQTAYDITDPSASVIDPVNTHSYTYDNNVHTAMLGYVTYFEKVKGNLSLNLAFNSTGMNRSEAYPTDYSYDHRYNSIAPTIYYTTQSMINRWTFNYSGSAGTPSVEQLRPRMDNSNLYSVSVGNPDLNQSYSHVMSLSYSTALGKEVREAIRANEAGDFRETTGSVSTISFSLNARMNQGVIVNKRTYFAADTYLPAYDYTMPAQSTLITYENVDNSYSAGFSANYDTPINAIMWNLNVNAGMNWDDSPSYMNEVLTRTENFRPSLRIGLRSNFSRNAHIGISGSGSYVYSNNTEKDVTKYFTERLNVNWDFNNIFKILYIGGNYTKSFIQGVNYLNAKDNILDMNAGLRFGPKNEFDFRVSVHDLFNKNTGFSTSMNSNFITNRWVHNFGRYVMFRFTYSFNSMPGTRGVRGPGGSGGGFGGPGFGGYGGYGGYRR